MFFVFILDKIGIEIVPKAIIIAIAAAILAKISGKSSVQIANNNNNDNKFIDIIHKGTLFVFEKKEAN